MADIDDPFEGLFSDALPPMVEQRDQVRYYYNGELRTGYVANPEHHYNNSGYASPYYCHPAEDWKPQRDVVTNCTSIPRCWTSLAAVCKACQR